MLRVVALAPAEKEDDVSVAVSRWERDVNPLERDYQESDRMVTSGFDTFDHKSILSEALVC